MQEKMEVKKEQTLAWLEVEMLAKQKVKGIPVETLDLQKTEKENEMKTLLDKEKQVIR